MERTGHRSSKVIKSTQGINLNKLLTFQAMQPVKCHVAIVQYWKLHDGNIITQNTSNCVSNSFSLEYTISCINSLQHILICIYNQ